MPFSFRSLTRRGGFSRGVNPPAAGGGGSPTVFTLVLDDLLTRHYAAKDQRFKLTATAGTTGFIELDDDATIYSASALASDMQTKLRALTGYSGKVDVSGASSEAGDKYTFEITFDGSLGAVTLDFDASSQWYPTISLVEDVTQQGASDEPGTYATASFNVLTASDGYHTASDGIMINVTVEVYSGMIIGISGTYSGYSIVGGGVGADSVTFQYDYTGEQSVWSKTGGDAGFGFTNGTDPVSGQQESHTVTPSPVNPTGGTWKPYHGGAAIQYNDVAATIEYEIGGTLNVVVAESVDAGISDGFITVTWNEEGDRSDTGLSPVNVNLTAPEITHSIT